MLIISSCSWWSTVFIWWASLPANQHETLAPLLILAFPKSIDNFRVNNRQLKRTLIMHWMLFRPTRPPPFLLLFYRCEYLWPLECWGPLLMMNKQKWKETIRKGSFRKDDINSGRVHESDCNGDGLQIASGGCDFIEAIVTLQCHLFFDVNYHTLEWKRDKIRLKSWWKLQGSKNSCLDSTCCLSFSYRLCLDHVRVTFSVRRVFSPVFVN